MDVNGYRKLSGHRNKSRDRATCSVRCNSRLALRIELAFGADVRESERLSYSIMLRGG